MNIKNIIQDKTYYGGHTLYERMKQWHIPAVSFAIVKEYKIIEAYAYGVKRRGKPDTVTADTPFQAASISKPVFAAAVMLLAEEGKLSLDEDVHTYLKDYDFQTYDGKKHSITLRQILSHTSGLNIHGFEGYRQKQKIPTIHQILEGASIVNSHQLMLVQEEGKNFMYSGGGYVLVQKIVCEVCGKDFNDIMNHLVLEPLKMVNSSYLQPYPKEEISRIAYGYDAYNLQIPGGYNIMPELSAAGLWTTPADLSVFGIEIMKAINGNSGFMSKRTAELMTTNISESAPTGLGFFISERDGHKCFGHDGCNNGYHSNMVFSPDKGNGAVAMTNADIGADIVYEITEAIFKEYRL